MNKLRHFFTRPAFIAQLTIVGWLAVVLLTGGPFRIGISTAFLLTVPGYYAYRLIAGYSRIQSGWVTAAYSVGLSIATLIATGFVVNEVGVYTGHPQPLTRLPLALAVAAVTNILAGISARRRPAGFKLVWKRPADLVTKVTGLLLPLIAVAGAITLNNGGSNVLAVTGLAAVAVYFVAITWRNGDGSSYPYALYMMSLAILLGTSMRGWNITGHDVMQEYQVFQLTSQHSVWHMHFYQDAYNACLSITILPTLLQRLTGIADAYVYKFIFQLYFALTAPVLYLSLRRYVPKVMAVLAAFVFITFPTYITDMTMLGRQETAFLFLALAILAGLDVSLGRIRRSALSFVFLSAMVLSHYSTSYVTLGILLLASLLGGGLNIWHRLKPRHNGRPTTRKYVGNFSPGRYSDIARTDCLEHLGNPNLQQHFTNSGWHFAESARGPAPSSCRADAQYRAASRKLRQHHRSRPQIGAVSLLQFYNYRRRANRGGHRYRRPAHGVSAQTPPQFRCNVQSF